MSQACRKSISTINIQLCSKTLRATWKVLENVKCMLGSKVFFCTFVISQFTCLMFYQKEKQKNIFKIMRRMTTAESRRGPMVR